MGSDVAVISASQMQSIKGLVDPVLDQSVLSTVELQRMKDIARNEAERQADEAREWAAKKESTLAKSDLTSSTCSSSSEATVSDEP